MLTCFTCGLSLFNIISPLKNWKFIWIFRPQSENMRYLWFKITFRISLFYLAWFECGIFPSRDGWYVSLNKESILGFCFGPFWWIASMSEVSLSILSLPRWGCCNKIVLCPPLDTFIILPPRPKKIHNRNMLFNRKTLTINRNIILKKLQCELINLGVSWCDGSFENGPKALSHVVNP